VRVRVVPVDLERHDRSLHRRAELRAVGGQEGHQAIEYTVVDREDVDVSALGEGDPSDGLGAGQPEAFLVAEDLQAGVVAWRLSSDNHGHHLRRNSVLRR
jgi:hypothetical protein